MFGNMGMGEIALIMVVILLLFGAKRIPEIAGSLGKGINSFKRNLGDVERAVREELPRDDARPADRVGSADRAPAQRLEDEARPEPKRLL